MVGVRFFNGITAMRDVLRPDPTGACADPVVIRDAAALFGLVSPTPDQISAFRDSAAALFSAPIASKTSFLDVERESGASIFGCLREQRVSGYLALMRLRPEGLRQVEQERFDPIEIDLELIARPGEKPAALYAWGFAATDPRSAYRVVSALDEIQRALFWAVPKFCAIASARGEKLALGRLGFRLRAPGDRFARIAASEAPPPGRAAANAAASQASAPTRQA
jgi:hypothetical protein